MHPQEGSIRHVWTYAYPLIVAHASFTVMQFMGRLFLSWHDADELAASLPSGVLSFLILSFFVGVASYANVFVAQFHGRGDRENLTRAMWQGALFSVLAGVLVVALLPVGVLLLRSSSHDPVVQDLEVAYFVVSLPGGLFAILNGALSSFYIGRGMTRVPMLVNLVGNLVNIALCYALVSGAPPFPELGIRGAAIALVAGNGIITVMFLALILGRRNREALGTWRLMRFHPRLFWRLMRFGLPAGVGLFLDIASFTAFIFLIGNVGRTALAANNIVLSLETISFMPILGISIATTTLVGQMMGEGRPEVAIRCANSAAKLNLLYTGTLAVLFAGFPDFFIQLFSMRNPEGFEAISAQARSLMRILAVFIVLDAVNITYAGAIKGAGDTRFQMGVSVACAWLFFVPGVWVLCNVLGYPIEWAWIWSTLYLALLAVAFYARFRSNRWQSIDLIGKEHERG